MHDFVVALYLSTLFGVQFSSAHVCEKEARTLLLLRNRLTTAAASSQSIILLSVSMTLIIRISEIIQGLFICCDDGLLSIITIHLGMLPNAFKAG